MSNFKITAVVLAIIICGCVQMRDYTGVREGVFGLDINKGFGEGADKKDYYVFKDGINLISGDSKDEIIAKIGLPDKRDITLDKSEVWTYEERKIQLYFDGERLVSWAIL